MVEAKKPSCATLVIQDSVVHVQHVLGQFIYVFVAVLLTYPRERKKSLWHLRVYHMHSSIWHLNPLNGTQE